MKRLFLLLLLPLLAQSDETGGGQKVFDNLKDLLVRVKAADSISSPKSSYGTGFAINKDGIVATNYHVISDYVMQPGSQWKIIVEMHDLKNLEGELIDFSVVDDLALIRIDHKFKSAIPLEENPTPNGVRAFSLGLPDDINMSIVEGVYNGVLHHGPYSLVHVTTPINAGMSGGPTVNSSGRLVGSNVSKLVGENNVSFIVPVERMKNLLKSVNFKGKVLDKKAAQDKIYSQLGGAQEKLVSSLAKDQMQKVELWKGKTIQVPEYLKCWSGGTEDPQLPYVMKKRSCRLEHSVFLANELETGTYSVEVEMLDASHINHFAVAQLMGQSGAIDSIISRFREEKFFGELDAREVFTPYECKQSFIKASFFGSPKTLRSGFCMRKYNKSKDLYDFSLSLYDFDDVLKSRVSISHSAVGLASIQKLITFWMERFK